MPEDMRRVVVDGFYALQQATFASPKRKSIEAYAAFIEDGGDLSVPNPAEKATFAAAAEPVQAWFTDNVDGRQRILSALKTAVAEDEAKIKADRAADIQLVQRRRLKHETAASYGSRRFLFHQVE